MVREIKEIMVAGGWVRGKTRKIRKTNLEKLMAEVIQLLCL